MPCSLDDLRIALLSAWDRDTAWKGKGARGSPLNQCMVTAMVVQDLMGGEILRARGPDGDTHYWNRLPDGQAVDLTAGQFGDVDLGTVYAEGEVWRRRQLRYSKLRARVMNALGLPGAEWPKLETLPA